MLVMKALAVHDAQPWLLSVVQVTHDGNRTDTIAAVGGTESSRASDANRMHGRLKRLGVKSAGGGGMLTVGIAVSLRRILWTFALFDSRMDLHAVRNAVRTPYSRFYWTAYARTCVSFCARDLR